MALEDPKVDETKKKEQPKAAAKQQMVVILHTAVGAFPRGKVLPAVTFGEDLPRLQNVKALRMATAEEATMESVDLDAVTSAPTNILTELHATIATKNAVIDQQEREIQALRGMNQTMAANTESVKVNELATRLAENEKTILKLQADLADANKKLADLKAK